MIRPFLLIIIIFFFYEAKANNKEQIILKFKDIKNFNFDFEQNINGKIEKGNCTIKYPKKIYCKYNASNNKILVSNGKSLVIKTDIGSYYRYPINNTPLDLILDKDLILNEIKNLDEKVIENKLIKFTLKKNELTIDIFFNKFTFNLAGWQTQDIYQNTNFTVLSNIVINKKIENKIFNLPKLD
mgnify:FL=1